MDDVMRAYREKKKTKNVIKTFSRSKDWAVEEEQHREPQICDEKQIEYTEYYVYIYISGCPFAELRRTINPPAVLIVCAQR